MNNRMQKVLGEILQYLDGEEVEGMKGLADLTDEGGSEAGSIEVAVTKKPEMGEDEGAGECPSCSNPPAGAKFCPGCGKKLGAGGGL